MARVREARQNGAWDETLRREDVSSLPEEKRKACSEQPDAREKFEALSLSHKKQFLNWIRPAKTTPTLEKREDQMIEMLKQNRRMGDERER